MTTRAWRWDHLLVLSCLAACGATSPPDSAGDDDHSELVETFSVMPRTCGVSRAITLLRGDLEISGIERNRDGFVASGHRASSSEPAWLTVSTNGVRQRLSFSGWTHEEVVLASFAFAESLTRLHPVLLTSVGGYSEARLHAWSLDTPGSDLDVGAHFGRGTTNSVWVTALDGSRGGFMAAHPGAFAPHLLPLSPSGTPAGSQLALDEGDVSCLLATPTADGFAAGAFYSAPTSVLRLVTIGSRGQEDVSMELSPGSCPLLQADRLLTVAVVRDDALQFFVHASGGLLPVLPASPSVADLGSAPRWLSRHEGGGFSLLVAREDRLRLAELSESGDLSWLTAELPFGTVIPAAPGELFLDVFAPDAAGNYAHRIVEITCSGVGFGPLSPLAAAR